MTTPTLRAFCLTALFVVPGFSADAANPTVSVYLSAPFTETAGSSGLPTSDGTATGTATGPANTPNTLGFSGAAMETFDTPVATGTYHSLTSSALGGTTFVTAAGNAGFTVNTNGQYGGGGQGNYLGVSPGSPVTITFNSPVGYFGLLWNAVDAGNSLAIYDQDGGLLGTFNASTFSSLLPNTAGKTITALNGAIYNTTDYFGQPTGTVSTANRQNSGEQYAYLNFVGTGGTTISKIVESETGAVFESDNYSTIIAAPTVNSTSHGNVVYVSSVPEPATWTLIAVAGGLAALGVRRRRA